MARKTIVLELVVESDDGPAAFGYLKDTVEEWVEEVGGDGLIDIIFERLSENVPVNMGLVSHHIYVKPESDNDHTSAETK